MSKAIHPKSSVRAELVEARAGSRSSFDGLRTNGGGAARRSWLSRNRWLLLRRVSQLAILALFLTGPWFGVWVLKGNLSASLIFDTVPLTDPLLALQSMAAGHWPYTTALTGAAIVLVFYLLVGGRVFCSWVCPVNVVTDAAAWLRRKLGIKTGRAPDASTRFWLLGSVLLATAATGVLVWEWVNPVSLLHRALIFGLWGSLWAIAGIFAYDLLIASRGWCGHLCPVGAFYGLLGRTALAASRPLSAAPATTAWIVSSSAPNRR
jgi:ferredoxin-type protein NapH